MTDKRTPWRTDTVNSKTNSVLCILAVLALAADTVRAAQESPVAGPFAPGSGPRLRRPRNTGKRIRGRVERRPVSAGLSRQAAMRGTRPR